MANLKTQQELATAWKNRVPSFNPENVHVLPSIESAVAVVRQLGSNPVDVLVTGSLHLVGGVIEVAGLPDVAL
jgi:folylpolyglutamate synthase